MVIDGDDQHGEDSSMGETKSFDLHAWLLHAYGDEETRARRGKQEQERNMFIIDTLISATAKYLLGKRKIYECDNHLDYASSSLSLSSVESKRRRGVSDEPSRAEPIREIKPPVRERTRPDRREPVRRKGPVKRESVRIEPVVTPDWVVDLVRDKNGVDAAKLIIQKEITASDLRKNQGRLLMPFNQMADMNFLTEAELNIMKNYVVKSRKEGVDVILVGYDGKEWKLNLRTWGMNSSSNFVLCTGWYRFALHHKLDEGHIIRLWSFHSQEGKLYFAFLRLPPAQAVALPQAQHPDQAMALALAPSIATTSASSSSMASFETRDSDDVFICVKTNKRLCNYPKTRMITQVCVPAPAPTRDSSDLGQSILEGLDLNRPLPQMCTEMAPLETVQETDSRTSLVSVTETTTLDLELRL